MIAHVSCYSYITDIMHHWVSPGRRLQMPQLFFFLRKSSHWWGGRLLLCHERLTYGHDNFENLSAAAITNLLRFAKYSQSRFVKGSRDAVACCSDFQLPSDHRLLCRVDGTFENSGPFFPQMKDDVVFVFCD